MTCSLLLFNSASTPAILKVKLPSGKMLEIHLSAQVSKSLSPKPKEDKVNKYAHLVLELGLLFKNFLECVQVPNRPRMLWTLKLVMVLLKAQNNLSKYADEILRFLVHHICSLSDRKAHEMFYALHVNTRGKIDTHIAVDLQMEYIVRSIKRHIKHMFSNKTQQNIERKTGALAAINSIVQRYDTASDVNIRSKKHKTASAHSDEVDMIEDLRSIKPFTVQEGRTFRHFPNTQSSLISFLDFTHFREWMFRRSQIHANSLGN